MLRRTDCSNEIISINATVLTAFEKSFMSVATVSAKCHAAGLVQFVVAWQIWAVFT